MERVETLIKKLEEQFAQNASPGQLLLTVQMLQAELLHLQGANTALSQSNDVVVTVSQMNIPKNQAETIIAAIPVEERTVELLQVDESEIEAELEEIKRNADAIQKISIHNKPHLSIETDEEIPTLTQQHPYKPTIPPGRPETAVKEINESIPSISASVNDRLKQSRIDLGDTLVEIPIRDLRKGIGVNDRFLFINELFRGDEAFYERSIKTINSFSIFPEAEYWIQRELKIKNGWNDSDQLVKQFYGLVKRRFS